MISGRMKQRSFTLIEFLVAIVIFMIFVMVIIGAGVGANGNSNITVGINGMMETRCIEGYKFIITQDSTRQILDEFGKGVRCSQELKINGQ